MKIQKRWKNGQKRIFLEISSMRTVDVLWATCHSTPRRRAGGLSRPSSHKTRVWEPQRPWSEFPQLVDTAQWHVVPTHIDETDEPASCWKAGGKVAVLGASADQTAWLLSEVLPVGPPPGANQIPAAELEGALPALRDAGGRLRHRNL